MQITYVVGSPKVAPTAAASPAPTTNPASEDEGRDGARILELVCDSALSPNRQYLPLAFFSDDFLREKKGILVWDNGLPLVPLSSCSDSLIFKLLEVKGGEEKEEDQTEAVLGSGAFIGFRLWQLT